MKRIIALLLAMLMVIGVFAGCTQQPDATDPIQTDPVATDPVETEPVQEPVTLTWWTYDDSVTQNQDDLDFKAEVEKKFPWITIEYTFLPFDTGPEKMTVAFATQSYPDIITDTYGRLGQAVDAGLTISLEPALANIDGLIDLPQSGIVNGEHHYIWDGGENAYSISCNMDLAEELGILDLLPEDGLTWTHEDFLNCCRAAKDAGYYGCDLYAGSQSSDMWYYSWLLANGVEITDSISNGGIITKTMFNTPEYREKALEVLNVFKTMVDEGLCQPGAATMIDQEAQPIWFTGQMLFCHGAFSNTRNWDASIEDGISLVTNYEMFAIPTADGTVGGGDSGSFGSSGIIAFDTADGAKLEAIYDVIAFRYSSECSYFQGIQDRAPGNVPVLDWVVVDTSEASEHVIVNNINRGNGYAVAHARSDWGPLQGWYADFRQTFFPLLQELYASNISAEQLLAKWESSANDVIANYKPVA